jgi:hypothetical protein
MADDVHRLCSSIHAINPNSSPRCSSSLRVIHWSRDHAESFCFSPATGAPARLPTPSAVLLKKRHSDLLSGRDACSLPRPPRSQGALNGCEASMPA